MLDKGYENDDSDELDNIKNNTENEIIEFISSYAIINGKNYHANWSILTWMSYIGHYNVLKLLLKNGFNINEKQTVDILACFYPLAKTIMT